MPNVAGCWGPKTIGFLLSSLQVLSRQRPLHGTGLGEVETTRGQVHTEEGRGCGGTGDKKIIDRVNSIGM
jgi:hypothetical protein